MDLFFREIGKMLGELTDPFTVAGGLMSNENIS